MNTHSWEESLAKGERGERLVSSWLTDECGYKVRPATDEEQRDYQIDFWVMTDPFHQTWESVQVKTDYAATSTGRAFIEIMANEGAQRYGWLYRGSGVSWLLYVVSSCVWVIRGSTLPKMQDKYWELHRRELRDVRICRNPSYEASGYAVPLSDLDIWAERRVMMPSEDPFE